MKYGNDNLSTTESPTVAIIILNWNNWQDTVECLESLSQIDYPNYQIIIVDNGSTDDSVSRIRQRFDTIQLLETGKNLGFSAGVNLGIAQAQTSDLILLLNNDTLVKKNFLTALVRKITTDDTIGIAGGKIYYYEITGSPCRPYKIWSAGGGMNRLTKRTFHHGEGKIDHGQFDQEQEVDFLSGCCLLIKTAVIEKIGLLDSDYFMYYEDVDFCLRAKAAGFKILYLPQSIIWHKVGRASSKCFIDYYRMRNYLWYLSKHFDFVRIKILCCSVPVFFERLVRIILRKLLYRDPEKLFSRIAALTKGFKEGLNYQI